MWYPLSYKNVTILTSFISKIKIKTKFYKESFIGGNTLFESSGKPDFSKMSTN